MRELIAQDPALFARFDTNGDGTIDGEEWDAVRQLMIRRLEREAAEAEDARLALAELDDAQAAELARMEAEMEAEDAAVAPTAGGARDFSNLELAFDPRAQPRSTGGLAEEIYAVDLAAPMRGSDFASGAHGIPSHRELVLEQAGGVKQLFGKLFRRSYVIRDARGDAIGVIGQRENEQLQDLTRITLVNYPDLHFSLEDYATNARYELRHSVGLGENSISLYTARRELARTSWTLSFLRRRYEVRCVSQQVSYYARRRLSNPWSYDVLNPFEEKIGELQRGWTGLGFLTMGNLFRIHVDVDVPPEVMWGLVTTALLADLDSESGSRGSFLDVFNG